MKVRVLFFSVLRDLAGVEEVEMTCETPASVASLLRRLYVRWPALEKWDRSLLVAVDQAYARREDPLHEGAEVAVMPPVQGG